MQGLPQKRTLKDLRINLGWSPGRLAKEAGITYYAVTNAESGRAIRAITAKAIADTLSKALGRELLVTDIEGLNVL